MLLPFLCCAAMTREKFSPCISYSFFFVFVSPILGTLTKNRDTVVRFGLSAEEVGLLLHQLPLDQPIELMRKPTSDESLYDGPTAPQKVFRIVPSPGLATIEWTVDFEIDGVGGQAMQNNVQGQTVTMQAGEVQIAMEIMRSSLPTLVGWTTMQDIAVQKAVTDAQNGVGPSGPPAADPFGF